MRGRYAREFALAVAGVASDPVAHVERRVEATTAPAVGSERKLSRSGIVEGNLILANPDGATVYERGVDFVETALGFDNLSIPAGTALSADYFYRPSEAASATPEPKVSEGPLSTRGGWAIEAGGEEPVVRVEGPRSFLSGVLSGGATAAGSQVFVLPRGSEPPTRRRLAAMTDAGPVVLVVSPAGVAMLGDGPFVAGNGWMLLEGLNWPWGAPESPVFTGWDQEEIVFGSEALNVSYGELA